MDRYGMMSCIAKTLTAGEVVHITVTEARGRTLVQHYDVSSERVAWAGQKWGGYGNLRAEYKHRCLDKS